MEGGMGDFFIEKQEKDLTKQKNRAGCLESIFEGGLAMKNYAKHIRNILQSLILFLDKII